MKGIVGTTASDPSDGYIEGSSTTTPVKTVKKEKKSRTSTKDYLTQKRNAKRQAMANRT
jgi:hypothetical protein